MNRRELIKLLPVGLVPFVNRIDLKQAQKAIDKDPDQSDMRVFLVDCSMLHMEDIERLRWPDRTYFIRLRSSASGSLDSPILRVL